MKLELGRSFFIHQPRRRSSTLSERTEVGEDATRVPLLHTSMAQLMIKRRELSEALGSLKSAVGTNVKARSQGVHREMIAAVESALKAIG